MKFYRINVSGVKFFLSAANIQSDGPNKFTERFDNSRATRMALDRSPELFTHIQRHLQGYQISWSDLSYADLANLSMDAEYLGLTRLQGLVSAMLKTRFGLNDPVGDVQNDDDFEDAFGNEDNDIRDDIRDEVMDEDIGSSVATIRASAMRAAQLTLLASDGDDDSESSESHEQEQVIRQIFDEINLLGPETQDDWFDLQNNEL